MTRSAGAATCNLVSSCRHAAREQQRVKWQPFVSGLQTGEQLRFSLSDAGLTVSGYKLLFASVFCAQKSSSIRCCRPVRATASETDGQEPLMSRRQSVV